MSRLRLATVALLVLLVAATTAPSLAAPGAGPAGSTAALGERDASTPAGDARPVVVNGSNTTPAGGEHLALVNRTNTTNVVRVADPNRSGYARASLDLSTALSIQREELQATLNAYTFAERMESLETTAEQRALLDETVARAAERADALLSTVRDARRAYVAGELSAAAYLAVVGRASARARALQSLLDRVDRYEDTLADVEDVRRRRLLVEAKLAALIGPVRSHAAAVVQGFEASSPVFLAASQTGATLSMVHGGDFYHETSLFGNFAGEGSSINVSRAEARFSAVYPWVTSPGFESPESADGSYLVSGLASAYVLNASYRGGTLVSYIDGTTGEVYRERQRKDLSRVPTTFAASRATDDLVLTVNRTYPGGPLRIEVENDKGRPVDGVVHVNSTRVGRTGPDGVLWTVSPSSEYVVSVDVGDTRFVQVLIRSTRGDVRVPERRVSPERS